MKRCAQERSERMKQLRSWHLRTLKVVSESMSVLVRTSERDCRTRTTGESCTASESWTRTKYFHDDHLSWRISTDGTPGSPTYGQVIGQQGSYPFGESWYSSSGNEFVFTTYQRDSESGLDYAMARYYDSTAARFCSADPVSGQINDPQTWDRYTYSRNDPIDLTDPSGQSWFSWFIDAVVGALAIALPEIDPALFSFMGDTAAATTTTQATQVAVETATVNGQFVGGAVQVFSAATAATSSFSTAPLAFGAAAASAAQLNQPQTPQQPQTQQANTQNCFKNQAFPQAFGPNANIQQTGQLNSGNPIGGHWNGTFQATFSNSEQQANFQSVVSQNSFIPPGARVGVTITQANGQQAVWGLHVERVVPVPGAGNALSFVAHLDIGDPNWDVVGIGKHIFKDYLKGHRKGSNLDPKCKQQ
jgi:RHS repeat-associated protein